MVIRKRINKKNKSTWIVDYRIGKSRKTPSFTSKKEAEAFMRLLRLKQFNNFNSFEDIQRTTLKQSINKYYNLISSNKAKQTQLLEKDFFEKLYDYFGDMELVDISLVEIEEFQKYLHKHKNLAASTVNRHFNTYKNFFSKCVDWKYLHRSPAERLKSLKEDEVKHKLWSDKELQLIINHAADWASDAFYFIAMTGIRAGEAANMLWEDIDFEKYIVKIRSFKGKGKLRTRNIPLTQILINHLLKIRNRRKIISTHVFNNANGLPVSSTHLSREMRRLLEKLGIKGLTLHGLRHTFITSLASQNHNLEKIRLLAGHSNLKTTMKYLHIQDADLKLTMEAFLQTKSIELVK